MSDSKYANELPLQVDVKNWADSAKPPYCKKTTLKTWIIDPTGAAGAKNQSICDYEPTRLRLVIIPIDQSVALVSEAPVATAGDLNTAGFAPQGIVLPVAQRPYEFFGPDAFWLNSLAANTVTRVTVIKEYC